jgi:mxaL protein
VKLWRTLLAPGSRSITAAFLLLLCALCAPQLNFPQKTYNYIVVFDITQSMDVEDYDLDGVAVSRLRFAREAVRRALRELPCGSRVGWGAFAEYRTILLLAPVEVCANYNDLLASLDRIDGRMRWANASEIRKGIYWAMRAAKEVGGQPDVLFLTDGQEAPPEVGPGLPMFDDLKRGEPRGWLVGVGGYTPRRIPRTDDDGRKIGYWRADEVMQLDDVVGASGGAETPNGSAAASSGNTSTTPAAGTTGARRPASHEQLSEVREPHLRALAEEVGFEYTHLTRLQSIDAAMQDSRFAHRRPAPAAIGWIPALAALLMLAVRFRPWVDPQG